MEHFTAARAKLNIPTGLEWIGKTRFSTIYWSSNALLRNLPAMRDIIRDRSLAIEMTEVRLFIFYIYCVTHKQDLTDF